MITKFNDLTIYRISKGSLDYTFKFKDLVCKKTFYDRILSEIRKNGIELFKDTNSSWFKPLRITIYRNLPKNKIVIGRVIIMINLEICRHMLDSFNTVLPVLYMVIDTIKSDETIPGIYYKITSIKISQDLQPYQKMSKVYDYKKGVIPFTM